jgi:predicted metalloprotease with PDZ domain
MGGKPGSEHEPVAFHLGARFLSDPLGAKIQFVYDGGCLQSAGLASGDIIIAINRLQATKENIQGLLEPYAVGDQVTFAVFRGDVLMEFAVSLTAAVADTYYLEITERECSRRNNWLHKPN